jgi:hypothetical protein
MPKRKKRHRLEAENTDVGLSLSSRQNSEDEC